MATNIAIAKTKNDLVSILRNIDISVPLRTEGRKSHHAERWTICRLLSTLAEYDALVFPLSLIDRERPDFLLQCSETRVGIEVTEAISEQYAAYVALAEREFPDALLEPAHFRWGAPNMSVEDMRNLLRQDQLTSSGWAGDRPEREWALYIESVIETKLSKLSKPGFDLFPENWLAIYDNLPLHNIDLEKAIGFLLPKLSHIWAKSPMFHSIYIEHGPVIIQFSPNETAHMVLNDLW